MGAVVGLEIEITANHRGAFQFKWVFVVLPHTRIIPNMLLLQVVSTGTPGPRGHTGVSRQASTDLGKCVLIDSSSTIAHMSA